MANQTGVNNQIILFVIEAFKLSYRIEISEEQRESLCDSNYSTITVYGKVLSLLSVEYSNNNEVFAFVVSFPFPSFNLNT